MTTIMSVSALQEKSKIADAERSDAAIEYPGEVNDLLICSVCKDPPVAKALQCPEGHITCGNCMKSMREHNEASGKLNLCPLCREEFSDPPARSLVVEQSVARLPAKCLHCNNIGFTRENIARHQISCLEAPNVLCAGHLEGCDWTGRATDRKEHEGVCNIMRICSSIDKERETDKAFLNGMKERFVDLALDIAGNGQIGKNKALQLVSKNIFNA